MLHVPVTTIIHIYFHNKQNHTHGRSIHQKIKIAKGFPVYDPNTTKLLS